MTSLSVLNNDHYTPNLDGKSSQAELDHGVADKDAGSSCENTEVDDTSSGIEQYGSEGQELKIPVPVI